MKKDIVEFNTGDDLKDNWSKQQKREILLYGTRKGEPQYMETLLAENLFTEDDVQKVKNAAIQNGFVKFRTTFYDGSAPNFIKAINI